MIDTGTFLSYIVLDFFFLYLLATIIRGVYVLFKNLR